MNYFKYFEHKKTKKCLNTYTYDEINHIRIKRECVS